MAEIKRAQIEFEGTTKMGILGSGSYRDLMKLVYSLHPALVGQQCELSLTDKEGDLITIANSQDWDAVIIYSQEVGETDLVLKVKSHTPISESTFYDELIDINALTSTVIKEEIAAISKDIQKVTAEEVAKLALVAHTGIMCNECKASSILGCRFQCSVCTDYNLCERCENAGVHEDHMLMKIRTPEQDLKTQPAPKTSLKASASFDVTADDIVRQAQVKPSPFVAMKTAAYPPQRYYVDVPQNYCDAKEKRPYYNPPQQQRRWRQAKMECCTEECFYPNNQQYNSGDGCDE